MDHRGHEAGKCEQVGEREAASEETRLIPSCYFGFLFIGLFFSFLYHPLPRSRLIDQLPLEPFCVPQSTAAQLRLGSLQWVSVC